MMKTFERMVGTHHRFAERKDPALRLPDSVPVEFVLLGYPIMDAPPLPDKHEPAKTRTPDRRAEPRRRARRKCQTPSA